MIYNLIKFNKYNLKFLISFTKSWEGMSSYHHGKVLLWIPCRFQILVWGTMSQLPEAVLHTQPVHHLYIIWNNKSINDIEYWVHWIDTDRGQSYENVRKWMDLLWKYEIVYDQVVLLLLNLPMLAKCPSQVVLATLGMRQMETLASWLKIRAVGRTLVEKLLLLWPQ